MPGKDYLSKISMKDNSTVKTIYISDEEAKTELSNARGAYSNLDARLDDIESKTVPSYSSSQNGKALTVSNGELAWDDITGANVSYAKNPNLTDGTTLGTMTSGSTTYDIKHMKNMSSAAASGLYKIAVDTDGHVTSATDVTKNDILAFDLYRAGNQLELTNNVFNIAKYCKNLSPAESTYEERNWNDATENGWYMGVNMQNSPSSSTDNKWYMGRVIAHNANYIIQEVWQFTASTDPLLIPHYMRIRTGATNPVWSEWKNITVGKQVPTDAKFTDTTYSAGTGLTLGTGNVINHTDSVDAKDTLGMYKIKFNASGHITGSSAVSASDIKSLVSYTGGRFINVDSNNTINFAEDCIDISHTTGITSWNDVDKLGWYRAVGLDDAPPSASSTQWWMGHVIAHDGGSQGIYLVQDLWNFSIGGESTYDVNKFPHYVRVRRLVNGVQTWTPWTKVVTSGIPLDGTGDDTKENNVKGRITFGYTETNGSTTTVTAGTGLDIYVKSDSANFNSFVKWSHGTTWGDEGSTTVYPALIGYHNGWTSPSSTAEDGFICIKPYPTTLAPWSGSVGLVVKKDHVYIDNVELSKVGHSHAFSEITSKPTTISGYGITDAKIDNGTITLGSKTITPLTSHQSVTDYDVTLSWNTRTSIAKIGTTDIHIKLPAEPSSSYTAGRGIGISSGTISLANYVKIFTTTEYSNGWNDITETGWWASSTTTNSPSTTFTNWWMGHVVSYDGGSQGAYVVQDLWNFAVDSTVTDMTGVPHYQRIRRYNNGAQVWTNWTQVKITDTTYSAGTGLTLGTGNVINHTDAVTAQDTLGMYKIKFNGSGHIKGSDPVTASDISSLGVATTDENLKQEVSSADSNFSIVVSARTNSNTTPVTTTAHTVSNVYVHASDGKVYAPSFHGSIYGAINQSGTTYNIGTDSKDISGSSNSWNNATANGWYKGSATTNAPSSDWYFGRTIAHSTIYTLQEVWQFNASNSDTDPDPLVVPYHVRLQRNGVWGQWKQVKFFQGLNTEINNLPTGSGTVYADDYFVSQYANGGSTNTDYYRRPVIKLWDLFKEYITIGTSGSGNAVTSVSIANESGTNNRKITFTKGSKFVPTDGTGATGTWDINISGTGAALSNQRSESTKTFTYGVPKCEWYDLSANNGTAANKAQNPSSAWFHHITMHHSNSAGFYVDLAAAFATDEIWYRRIENGSHKGWVRLIDSSNIGSQSVAFATSATTATSATSATTASKLSNTSKIGDTNKPVYFTASGVPSAISYTIDKNVPSSAVFTDENVTQTESASEYYKPILLSNYTTTSSTSDLSGQGTSPGATQFSRNLRVNPYSGNIYIAGKKVAVEGVTTYAASSSSGGPATSAEALTSTSIGNSTKPVYFNSSGKPVACTYTLSQNVTSSSVLTDEKVTQSSTTYNGFRPVLLGYNNSTSPGSSLTATVTEQVYACSGILAQPSSGDLTLYSASGDSPSLIFRRGTLADTYTDWKIYDKGGYLYFASGNSSTWKDRMYIDTNGNGNLYVGGQKVAVTSSKSYDSSESMTKRGISGIKGSSPVLITDDNDKDHIIQNMTIRETATTLKIVFKDEQDKKPLYSIAEIPYLKDSDYDSAATINLKEYDSKRGTYQVISTMIVVSIEHNKEGTLTMTVSPVDETVQLPYIDSVYECD